VGRLTTYEQFRINSEKFEQLQTQLAEAQGELEQLRKVKDAAEGIEYGLSENDTCKCEWCTVSRKLRQALAQAKEVK
jgi:hypothetical protein